MIPSYSTLGIRFDYQKASGVDVWMVFWRVVDPELIRSSLLYAGDTDATLNRLDNVFCIAVQCSDLGALEQVKTAFGSNEAFLQVAANPRFVEGHACTREPLVEVGRIDAAGNFVGDPSSARTALGTVRKERAPVVAAAIAVAKPRIAPASERTRNLPDAASFRDVREVFRTRFMALEYSKYLKGSIICWLSPEELADFVDKYTELLLVRYEEYSVPITEDICNVALYDKMPSDDTPIVCQGLFSFASVSDAKKFCDSWSSAPDYACALPRLAGIRGKYQFNFCDGGGFRENRPQSPITAEALWQHLSNRQERFVADLQKQTGASRQAVVAHPGAAKTAKSIPASTKKPWWKWFSIR